MVLSARFSLTNSRGRVTIRKGTNRSRKVLMTNTAMKEDFCKVTRKEAISLGMYKFYSGNPCLMGHVGWRKVHSYACLTCATIEVGVTRKTREQKKKDGLLVVDPKNMKQRTKEGTAKNSIKRNRRRARLYKCAGHHDYLDVLEILRMQFGLCGNHICRKPLIESDSQVDHIVPISKGGSNWPDNLQILCNSCNASKGSKMPDEWDGIVKCRGLNENPDLSK